MSDFDIGLPPYITYLRKILNKYTDGQILKVNFIIKISFCLYFKQFAKKKALCQAKA